MLLTVAWCVLALEGRTRPDFCTKPAKTPPTLKEHARAAHRRKPFMMKAAGFKKLGGVGIAVKAVVYMQHFQGVLGKCIPSIVAK